MTLQLLQRTISSVAAGQERPIVTEALSRLPLQRIVFGGVFIITSSL
jgi:hypothetical protein